MANDSVKTGIDSANADAKEALKIVDEMLKRLEKLVDRLDALHQDSRFAEWVLSNDIVVGARNARLAKDACALWRVALQAEIALANDCKAVI